MKIYIIEISGYEEQISVVAYKNKEIANYVCNEMIKSQKDLHTAGSIFDLVMRETYATCPDYDDHDAFVAYATLAEEKEKKVRAIIRKEFTEKYVSKVVLDIMSDLYIDLYTSDNYRYLVKELELL